MYDGEMRLSGQEGCSQCRTPEHVCTATFCRGIESWILGAGFCCSVGMNRESGHETETNHSSTESAVYEDQSDQEKHPVQPRKGNLHNRVATFYRGWDDFAVFLFVRAEGLISCLFRCKYFFCSTSVGTWLISIVPRNIYIYIYIFRCNFA